MFAKISVQGKSDSDAANKAIDAIDLLRGIWNLYHNKRSTSSGLKEPVNKVVIGPLHTLHFPNGKLATDYWWYETDYRGPLNVFDLSREIEGLYLYQSKVRKLLKKVHSSHSLS